MASLQIQEMTLAQSFTFQRHDMTMQQEFVDEDDIIGSRNGCRTSSNPL
jgi:hypothetical protein